MASNNSKVSFKLYLNRNLNATKDFDIDQDITETLDLDEDIEDIALNDLLKYIQSKCKTINGVMNPLLQKHPSAMKLVSYHDSAIVIEDDDDLRGEIDAAAFESNSDDSQHAMHCNAYVELRLIIERQHVSDTEVKDDDEDEFDDALLAEAIQMSLYPIDDLYCDYHTSKQRSNDIDHIIQQLLIMQIGTKQQIIEAMQIVNNKYDINELMEYLLNYNKSSDSDHMSPPAFTCTEYQPYLSNNQSFKPSTAKKIFDLQPSITSSIDDDIDDVKTDKRYPVLPLIIPNNCTYDPISNKMTINREEDRNLLKTYKPAIEFIRNISSKIATISIVGSARTGKSLVAGELYAPQYGPCPFDLGHTMDACTYGIWVSAQAISHPHQPNTVILIFDVEGTDYHEATKHNDMQLMVIALLISSYFIYNTKGTFDANALEKLEFVTELTDRIQMKPHEVDGNGMEHVLPIFMWLLRDHHLQPTDKEGKHMSVKEYFTQNVLKFRKGKSTKVQKRQEIRRVFMETFRKYDAYGEEPNWKDV